MADLGVSRIIRAHRPEPVAATPCVAALDGGSVVFAGSTQECLSLLFRHGVPPPGEIPVPTPPQQSNGMAVTKIAAQQLLVLTQALAHEGFDSGPLAQQAGVATPSDIRARPWRPVAELDALMQSCRDISGDDGFGLVVGTSFAQLRAGTIALVVPNAPTLRTALDDLGLFYPMVQDQKEVSYGSDGNVCSIYFEPIGGTADAKRFRAEQIMGGLVTLLRLFGLVDEDLQAIHFQHGRPSYAQRYAEIFGDSCDFNRSISKIAFRASILDSERSENLGAAYLTARATALTELAETAERHSIAATVRHAIRDVGFRRCGMGSVAATIGFNERTLRRQLSREGLTFQEIYDDLRLQESKKLLGQRSMPLKQIADLAGFETAGNFHRAFKRMTGLTPAQWRQANVDQRESLVREG